MGWSLRNLPLLAIAACVLAFAGASANAGVLDAVKQRKMLLCGVDPGLAGFATVDDQKQWTGFDVDYCRAIAAAVLGDPKAVTFVPLTARERFRALQQGAVDVLIRNTAWTMARDTTFGVSFVGVNFYNGQGFMVPKALGVDSALQLSGAKICLEAGSQAEIAVAAYFKAHSMSFTSVAATAEAQPAAYQGGGCSVATGDVASLYAERLALQSPQDSIVLPEVLSKEAYGPAVLQSDYRWAAVVRWVHFALVNAEELDVTRANVDAMRASDNSDIRQLLGSEGALGKGIGLDAGWAANAIKAVGNYGEIFERNLGQDSRLKMPRGLNALWTDGGLQFAPPVR
ncbi:MAG TPA: amino acid ABC transporter substrate-binding protein [Bauldia sp.]|nr:amino acid ABC transporter substrate-binding protein [Bauldia sp.]